MNTIVQPLLLIASKNPEQDIEKISYPGQPLTRKMYRTGYENYFNSLPIIEEDDSLLDNLFITKEVMKNLSQKLEQDTWNTPEEGEFHRTIIALEEPKYLGTWLDESQYQEGAELVVAQWGLNHTSPIHGHAQGYMHEQILSGKMRVNTYRIVDEESKTVRIVETTIQKPGVFVSQYAPKISTDRNVLVHNFTAVEPSVSLHYLPEHTRDGRDNTYNLEEFGALWRQDVVRIDSKEGMYLQKGDVVLVRSSNVPEYGDHFLIVTGHPVMKEHGFRVQDRSILASESHTKLLDMFPQIMGLTLLKLNKTATEAFHTFHGILIDEDKTVTFIND